MMMKMVSEKVRSRVEAQGFLGLSDATLDQIHYRLRFSPVICMVWTAVGTLLGSAAILWALVPFAALGAILPRHPFDLIYNRGLRHLMNGAPIPRYAMPRRFACLLAAATVAIAAWGFQSGQIAVGIAAGGIFGRGRFGQCDERLLHPVVHLWLDLRAYADV